MAWIHRWPRTDGLGYGQSAPNPTQLQAATELRQMQRRLHNAEQALAAERALHQQPHHPPPPPPQPQCPPQQHPGPSWGNSNGQYNDGQLGYRAYSCPIAAEHSDKFAEWERKEELKAHRIELFDGKQTSRGCRNGFGLLSTMDDFLATRSNESLIRRGSFSRLKCLTGLHMLRREYGVTDFPPPRYPFGWTELKVKMEATYASPFSVNYVWRGLTSLKHGRGVVSFHSRFTKLARLVDESPDSALSLQSQL